MSSNIDSYKTDLEKLVKEAERLISDFAKNQDKAQEFNTGYQNWYSEAQEVIRQILPNSS